MVTVVLAESIVAADLETGGPDSLTVTCKRRVGGADSPQYARVTLMRLSDKRVVRAGWSDPVTGAITFQNLETTRTRYLSLAEYPTNPDNPHAENYLRPEAGVSPLKGEGAE